MDSGMKFKGLLTRNTVQNILRGLVLIDKPNAEVVRILN